MSLEGEVTKLKEQVQLKEETTQQLQESIKQVKCILLKS